MTRRFRGESVHKVDQKGRVSVPAAFRRVLEEGDPDWTEGLAPNLVLIYGMPSGNCIEGYTVDGANRLDDKVARLPTFSRERRALERLLSTKSVYAQVDENGRIVLPQRLREEFGLETEAYFAGMGAALPDLVARGLPRRHGRASTTGAPASPRTRIPSRSSTRWTARTDHDDGPGRAAPPRPARAAPRAPSPRCRASGSTAPSAPAATPAASSRPARPGSSASTATPRPSSAPPPGPATAPPARPPRRHLRHASTASPPRPAIPRSTASSSTSASPRCSSTRPRAASPSRRTARSTCG